MEFSIMRDGHTGEDEHLFAQGIHSSVTVIIPIEHDFSVYRYITVYTNGHVHIEDVPQATGMTSNACSLVTPAPKQEVRVNGQFGAIKELLEGSTRTGPRYSLEAVDGNNLIMRAEPRRKELPPCSSGME